jgi:opacity protein-like surface antigen
VRLTDSFGDLGTFKTDGGGLALGAIGYKNFGSNIRVEVEGGYTWHNIHQFDFNGTSNPAGGHSDLGHVLFNGIYDIPVSDIWSISLGGGVGIGFEDFRTGNPVLSGRVNEDGFMWQAIGGLNYKILPNMEAFVDYRYRDVAVSNRQPIIGGGSVTVYGPSENAVIGGIRWYLWSPSY